MPRNFLSQEGYLKQTYQLNFLWSSVAIWWHRSGSTLDHVVACFETAPRHDRNPWWRHKMEIFSALLAICAGNSPVTGEFPTQRPVTWSFDVYFDLRPNERLSKQWRDWWFGTLSRSLWRHRNAMIATYWWGFVASTWEQCPRHHSALQWRHNKHPGASNRHRLDCLFNHLFRLTSKKTSKSV